jgi:ferredoxin-thioredoxin reductase catalytic subunit
MSTPEENVIRRRLTEFLKDKDFSFNPDETVVDRVIQGLIRREMRYGKAYCPCRVIVTDSENDNIVCPCVFHSQELWEHGRCYCGLFVKKNATLPGVSQGKTS